MALYKKLIRIKEGLKLSTRDLGRIFGYSHTHIGWIITNKISAINHYKNKSFDIDILNKLENIVFLDLEHVKLDISYEGRQMLTQVIINKDYDKLSHMLKIFRQSTHLDISKYISK